jgi:hypothetical protein
MDCFCAREEVTNLSRRKTLTCLQFAGSQATPFARATQALIENTCANHVSACFLGRA